MMLGKGSFHYLFSSIVRGNFEKQIISQEFKSLSHLYTELNRFETVNWNEQDLKQMKGAKFAKLLSKLDRRVRRMMMASRNSNSQQSKQNQAQENSSYPTFQTSQLGREGNHNVFTHLFEQFPRTPFSLTQSFLYLFCLQTQFIKQSQNILEDKSDYFSKFSGANSSKASEVGQMFSSLPALVDRHQFYDQRVYSQILSFLVDTQGLHRGKVERGYLHFLDRWSSIEQEFSTVVFKNYDKFKSQTLDVSSIFKKPKGTFEFELHKNALGLQTSPSTELSDKNSINQRVKQIVYILERASKFGLLSDKFRLAAELLMKQLWSRDRQTLSKVASASQIGSLLKVIVIGGRTLKLLDQNIVQLYEILVSQRDQDDILDDQTPREHIQKRELSHCSNVYSLLSYIALSKSENHYLVEKLFFELQALRVRPATLFKQYNHLELTVEWYLLRLVTKFIKSHYGKDLSKILFTDSAPKQIKNIEPVKCQTIASFLSKYNYNYAVRICNLTSLAYYQFYQPNQPTESSNNNSTGQEYQNILFPLPATFYNPTLIIPALSESQLFLKHDSTIKSQKTKIAEKSFEVKYEPNGVHKLLHDCYSLYEDEVDITSEVPQGKIIKSVNLAMFGLIQKLTPKEDFLKRKLKGIKKVGKIRTRKFDF